LPVRSGRVGSRSRREAPGKCSSTWPALVARSGEAILVLGLDPLPQSASASRVDAYLDTVLAADRLLFGRARTR
jgi:hypothetical protein